MSIYSNKRTLIAPDIDWSNFEIPINQKNTMNGRRLLKRIPDGAVPIVFFDPQYRGLLEKMKYGNEGSRQKARAEQKQMSSALIGSMLIRISEILMPGGHLFLWVDKFRLCEGVDHWMKYTSLTTVDMITWDKMRIGMGYRTRRQCEYLLVLQKKPKRVKGVWVRHDIPDIYQATQIRVESTAHPKPIKLQTDLILAVTNKDDIVVDPAAGSYTVMAAAHNCDRQFLGCDIV